MQNENEKKTGYVCESGFSKCGGFDYTYAKSVCSTCFDKKKSPYM